MNRVVNILTFLFLGVYCFMLMVVVLDLSLSNLHLKGMPYKQEIFAGFAVLVFLMGMIRAQRRWQGMKDMRRYTSFAFVAEVARKHRMRGVALTLLEAAFFCGALFFCLQFLSLEPNYVIPMLAALGVLILESLVFAILLRRGGASFRIGINDQVIACFDREMHLYYYTGLQRVELYQADLINLGYREDLNLSIETTVLSDSDRPGFRDTLVQTLEQKGIYVNDSLRNWK